MGGLLAIREKLTVGEDDLLTGVLDFFDLTVLLDSGLSLVEDEQVGRAGTLDPRVEDRLVLSIVKRILKEKEVQIEIRNGGYKIQILWLPQLPRGRLRVSPDSLKRS